MHLDKNDLIMVGDRITTDIQEANYFGLRSVLIKVTVPKLVKDGLVNSIDGKTGE